MVAGAVSLAEVSSPSLPVLSKRVVDAYVASAYALEARYVDQAWCDPLLDGSLGSVPTWPRRLGTRAAIPAFTAGPARARIPHADRRLLLDMSDARAILPPTGDSWQITPRFCVYQSAYPRLQTSGGRALSSYPPLPKRLHTLNQIFDRFPPYLGRVVSVGVPLTIEVAYAMSVDGATPQNYHEYWLTSLGMVPAGPGTALKLDAWALDAPGAYTTVLTDAPLGPVMAHPSAPGSGP